jgi:hypothetical protein
VSEAANSPSSSTIQKAHATPNPAETVTGAGEAGSSGHRKAPVGRFPGASGIRGRRRSPSLTEPAQTPTLNPCTLVTGAQAQAIVGASVLSKKEAPLGPTCIFEFKGRPVITIAIESLPFAKTVGEMHKRTRVVIGGFHADCGTQGTQMLFVSLGRARVLNVSAPCPLAKAFAIKALSHLHG